MWQLTETEHNVWHIYPVGDTVSHQLDVYCLCKPTKKIDEYEIWSHHSYDWREFFEGGKNH